MADAGPFDFLGEASLSKLTRAIEDRRGKVNQRILNQVGASVQDGNTGIVPLARLQGERDALEALLIELRKAVGS